MHRDLGSRTVDLSQIIRRELDCNCSNVFFQAFQFRGAWDRNNPRFLREQPRERDLSRCCLFLFCDAAEQIDQGLIRLERLRRESRESAAKVGAVELRVFVDLPREEALAKRAVRNETNSEFLKRRY